MLQDDALRSGRMHIQLAETQGAGTESPEGIDCTRYDINFIIRKTWSRGTLETADAMNVLSSTVNRE